MPPTVKLSELLVEPEVFGKKFTDDSWRSWRTIWKAAEGGPLTSSELELYKKISGRETTPSDLSELWLIVGRRAGKSVMAAAKAVELACFHDYREHLQPGEIATVMVLAADKKQARVVFRYIEGFLNRSPMLSTLVTRRTQTEIELSNRVAIEVHTASFRSVRGYSLAAVIADELAFWRNEEAANPDEAILAALRPGLATIPGSLLMVLSSPYSRRGALWKAFRKYFGAEAGAVLVLRAASRILNPTLPEKLVQEALESDPVAARAEWLGEFRSDLEGYVSQSVIDACTVADRHELPRVEGVKYRAFVDPSGGSRDSFTLAISHLEGNLAVLDLVRERKPPFSPEGVTEDFSRILASYGIRKVQGDRYAGNWPAEQFAKRGIEYIPSPLTKSDIYRDLLPKLNSGRVELLDHPRLAGQLGNLERKTTRGGKDSIDHAPGAHDDLANAACGALLAVCRAKPKFDYSTLSLNHGAAPSRWKGSPAVHGQVTLM